MKDTPIFIHSLFRSGSTYLFNVFRQSKHGYWCYQEPLHEFAVAARDEPDNLFVEMDTKKRELLRHPALNKPYFEELFETWPAWKDLISESIIYDAYFSGANEDIGIPFWQALSEVALGRPVFQECRTSGRIGAIKNQMGGYHIYLWRNPWDQWWSYKVDSYFDAANQLILHARQTPVSLQRMIASLSLSKYEGEDLDGAFDFYRERPMSSEQSYLVFYHLWCLALREGMLHADMLLNIDCLSDSTEFQLEVQNQLNEAGIDPPDFSDCRVPQGFYLEKEQVFFSGLEDQVHQWLLDGGWTLDEINQIQALRRENEPIAWGVPISDISPVVLAEQVSRAHQVARYYETTLSELALDRINKINNANDKAREAETKAREAETKAREAEAFSSAQLANVQALRNSTSWKITGPMRALSGLVRQLRGEVLRQNLRLFLQHAVLYIERRPKFKSQVVWILSKFPNLKSRLLHIKRVSPIDARWDNSFVNELSEFSPHVRRIYRDLKTKIDSDKGGNL